MATDATRWDGPGLDAWRAWEPAEVARRLEGVAAAWCVVGGWSIDLFLGRRTREHDDLEIATTTAGLPAIRRRLSAVVFHSVGDGSVRRLADDELGPSEHHQHWCLDEQAGEWRLDVMVEPGDARRWVFRRDERISAARAEMVATTQDGIPFLRSHGTLLYKAKARRDKDEADFNAVIDHMPGSDRRWLHAALTVVHPGHAWLERL